MTAEGAACPECGNIGLLCDFSCRLTLKLIQPHIEARGALFQGTADLAIDSPDTLAAIVPKAERVCCPECGWYLNSDFSLARIRFDEDSPPPIRCPYCQSQHIDLDIEPGYEALDIRDLRCEDCGHGWEATRNDAEQLRMEMCMASVDQGCMCSQVDFCPAGWPRETEETFAPG